MSWYRQVKTLATVTMVAFFYILWVSISNLIFNNEMGYDLFLLVLLLAFTMQYFYSKKNNKALIIGILTTFSIIGIYLVYKNMYAVINSGFILCMLLLINQLEEEQVSYEAYIERAKKSVWILIGIGLILPKLNYDITKNILRFYIIFIAILIIMLREVRKYTFKIKGNSFIVNVSIMSFIALLSSKTLFSIVLKILHIFWKGISFILDKILLFFLYLLQKPMEFIIEKLRRIMMRHWGEVELQIQNQEGVSGSKYKLPNHSGIELSSTMTLVMKGALAVIILFLFYKTIKKVIKNTKKNELSIVEEREHITKKNKGMKKQFFTEFLNRIFGENTVNSQIRIVFKKFQKRTYDKGIFKKYMTATQLSNVAKIHMEEIKSLDSISQIYNEARFSNHELEGLKLKNIREDYINIKKQI